MLTKPQFTYKIKTMRILLDTNILILRENYHVIPDNVAKLMRLLNGLETCSINVHPLSVAELKKDKNKERQEINVKKVSSYAVMEDFPNYMEDQNFIETIGYPKNSNDIVDNQLLYCVYLNVVDYLITEDQALLNKADLLGLKTVVNTNEAITIFEQFYSKTDITLIQSFIKDKAYNFKLNEKYKVYTHQYVREDVLDLYGFMAEEEKDLFLKLISVSGIGPKSALSMLASGSVKEIVNAIENRNDVYLKKFPGIGQKASQQIILDLRGKLNFGEEVTVVGNSKLEDVELALIALGYAKKDVTKIVSKLDPSLDEGELVKHALKQMIK